MSMAGFIFVKTNKRQWGHVGIKEQIAKKRPGSSRFFESFYHFRVYSLAR